MGGQTLHVPPMTIDFRPCWLDAELALYQGTLVRCVEQQMQPHDEAARRQGHVGHALWRQAGEVGLLCADIPERYGGGGGEFRHEALVYDTMHRRALTGMNTSVHSIVAPYRLNHGTEAQQQKYLPRLARGARVGAIAMTEPDAGSDPQGWP